MDTVTALSGSGPAYFFLLVEALEDAAVAAGTAARDRAHAREPDLPRRRPHARRKRRSAGDVARARDLARRHDRRRARRVRRRRPCASSSRRPSRPRPTRGRELVGARQLIGHGTDERTHDGLFRQRRTNRHPVRVRRADRADRAARAAAMGARELLQPDLPVPLQGDEPGADAAAQGDSGVAQPRHRRHRARLARDRAEARAALRDGRPDPRRARPRPCSRSPI